MLYYNLFQSQTDDKSVQALFAASMNTFKNNALLDLLSKVKGF